MIDTLSLIREGNVFHLQLSGMLEKEKAAKLAEALEGDGLSPDIDALSHHRRTPISAVGLIQPQTARTIIEILAS